jgi:hypothetical protein
VAHEKTVYPDDFARSCANCKFCESVTNPVAAQSMMFCRKRPPSSAAQCIGLDPATGQVKWMYTTLWPMVTSADWCNEHVMKLQ